MQNANMGQIQTFPNAFLQIVSCCLIQITGIYMVLGGDLNIGSISYCECNGERYGRIEKDIDLWR